MLELKLRQEFIGRRMQGTAIELSNDTNTGATEIPAQEFLAMTYPTHDLLKAIEAVGPNQARPVVTIGERGIGKSHVMATLHHAVSDARATTTWLQHWASVIDDPRIGAIPVRHEMTVIGESLHRQRYKFLWDILFERHPEGTLFRGRWEGMNGNKPDVPSDQLMLEMFRRGPTMLLLDEFQTWFDGLTNTRQYPWRHWAFNFVQILCEIAKNHPELLVLVVSVRNGTSDAFKQVHRNNPVLIDFRGGGSTEKMQTDRRRMLLHRLFENRRQIAPSDVEELLETHVEEYFRLLDTPASEQERKKPEFVEAWPFAPHLLQLLEDQVLIATDAQETRDLIRILANLFKSRGDKAPVLTAAHFRLEDDKSEIGALLDSVANVHHRTLREKALRNLTSVKDAVPEHASELPHLDQIIAALWLRSIAVGNLAGAESAVLQAEATQSELIDNNGFQAELTMIVENSFNIHEDGGRLVFKEEENPQAKVMASARNDRLFTDGSDLSQLAKEVRYVIAGPEEVAKTFRVIALPQSWTTDPWSDLDEREHPDNWDERLPLLVLPEEPDCPNKRLGNWLKDHLQQRRNTVRFVVPRNGTMNTFHDRDLVILARAEMKAQEWSKDSAEYRRLQRKYQTELRDILKKRYDRFALLNRWDFVNPDQCEFHLMKLSQQGAKIPEAIEEATTKNLFEPEEFEALVLEAAGSNSSIGKVLSELREPRPSGNPCIPWLGETSMKERIIRLCARGKIAIDLRGMEYLQAQAGEDEAAAWQRLRAKVPFTGRQLEQVRLLEPSAVPSTGGATPATPGDSPTGTQPDTPAPGKPAPPIGGGTPPTEPPGGIFGPGSPAKRTPLASPATSALNLIGRVEAWGIGPGTALTEVTLKIPAATGAQLKSMLKKLPDGMKFELSLDKEET